MYLFDFFNSLTLLDKEKIPDISIFPKEDVFYFGYCKKSEILDIQRGNDEHYLAYTYRTDVKKLHYLGIDAILEYMDILQQEPFYSFSGEFTAIYEAIWLFDELNVIHNPFFDMILSVPLPSISSTLSEENIDELTIADYDGIPLLKKLYMAQFKYYIKKYLQAKSKFDLDVKEGSEEQLNFLLITVMKKYLKNVPLTYHSQSYTNECNREFDEFIQQIGYYANRDL